MKTLQIKDLKKEILVVELTEGQLLMDFNNLQKLESNGFKKLGKPDEIKEKDVLDLVERVGLGHPSYSGEWYKCYNNPDAMYSKAKDSFNSALEKHLFWVNPEPYPSPYDPRSKTGRFEQGEELEKAEKIWKEAQEKTFDRKRTLIFVKN